jgi:hypothetical protein
VLLFRTRFQAGATDVQLRRDQQLLLRDAQSANALNRLNPAEQPDGSVQGAGRSGLKDEQTANFDMRRLRYRLHLTKSSRERLYASEGDHVARVLMTFCSPEGCFG